MARSFEFTVSGQYYGAHDTTGAPTVKLYTAKFALPSQEAALSVICKYLLDPYLRKNYPDYAKFRSHKITSVVTHGTPPNMKVLQMSFDDMTIDDLADFCIIKRIFVDPFKHKDLEKCRSDIRAIWDARVSQEKADKKSGLAEEKREADELLKLNKLEVDDSLNPNVTKINKAADEGLKAKDTPVKDDPLAPAGDDDILA